MPPSPFVCPELEPPNSHVFSRDEEYDPRDPPICCEHCGLTPEEFVASLPPEETHVSLFGVGIPIPERVPRGSLQVRLEALDGGTVRRDLSPQEWAEHNGMVFLGEAPGQEEPAPAQRLSTPPRRTQTPLQKAATVRNWRLLTLRGVRSTLTRILAEHNRALPETKMPEEDYARLAEILVKLEQVSGVVPPPAQDPVTGYY